MTKKKLHILFINSWYPSKVLPNNGDFIQRHAEAVSTKFKVTSVHVISDATIEKETITDNVINEVRTLIAYIKPARSNFNKQIRFFNSYKKLISLSDPFDLVHVNRLYPVGLIAVWLKLYRSKPYIISEHFTGYLKPHSKNLGQTEILLSKFITKQANFVCPVSQNLGENMNRLGFNGNFYRVPNVVDTSIFTPNKAVNKRFTLIHISSLIEDHKNVTGILHVIAKLQNYIPEFLFYLIGDNPFQYQSLIDLLNIDPNNIQLIDQIPHDQVATYLQKSDVFILFSNYENLPCVILEAFACGTKVISTNVGGVKEFFPDNFGTLITSKDEVALLNSILEMQKNKNSIGKIEMHQYAKRNFGIDKISDEFSKLYYRSLNKKIT